LLVTCLFDFFNRLLSYIERINSPHRILRPLIRRPGSSSLEPVTWEMALNTIADKLRTLKRDHGQQSVLFYAGSGSKGLLNSLSMEFWRLFGGCTTTYGDLCWPAGLEATRLTLGANKHNAPWDLEKARLILLWGKNPAETNIHQMVFIEKAIESGAKLIVIDPRRTESTERADLLIQPRPGTDGAIALGAANILISKGLIDLPFITKHLLGFEEFAEKVKAYAPKKAAAISDTPVEAIYALADSLGAIKPATICAGYGMQRYSNSGQTIRAIISLLAITGNIGKPGAGWIYANLQSHVFDKIRDPVASFPSSKTDSLVRASVSTARFGQDIIESHDPTIKMAWIERGNPVSQNPDTHNVQKALRSLDFVVVVDQFLTDTAREADIILPAKSMFEQSDIITAYWHSYIQLKQKILNPPGDVKPESEIYLLLARKLGFAEEEIASTFPKPTDEGINEFLEKKLSSFPSLTMESLRRGPVLAPGFEEVAFSDFVFPTPSGKIELYSKEAMTRWNVDPLPEHVEQRESSISLSRGSARFPLNLVTPNTKNRIHSQFNNLEMIRLVSPGPYALINPLDGEKRKLSTGDMVRVFNDRGEVKLEARFDLSIKPGVVSITNGWSISEGGAVNFCSLGRETDIGYGAAFHDNMVEVEAITDDK